MTREEAQITHILEQSPRGFANEVTVLPVTREYALVASEAANRTPENGWASVYAWNDAPAKLRSASGLILREMREPQDLQNLLMDCLLPFFGIDPDAYDYVDGQWVPAY